MKICLCGSTKFMDQFHQANMALSLQGHVVYSVATSVHGDFKPTDDQKLALDMVHLRKIHESDAVVVVGRQEDGSMYIGESTRREILYANVWGKRIHFWDPREDASGPFTDFVRDIKEASTTDAEVEEMKRKAREAQQVLFEKMGLSMGEHTGQPDCPACADQDQKAN